MPTLENAVADKQTKDAKSSEHYLLPLKAHGLGVKNEHILINISLKIFSQNPQQPQKKI